MNTLSDGMRFNVIGVRYEFDKGNMSIFHTIVNKDISFSEVQYAVHAAKLKYGQDNVMLEPARLYNPLYYGFEY